MLQKKICLASDNWSPAHPLVIQAVIEANEGSAPSYGADRWTEEAQELIQEVFQSQCKVFFVPSGTGANVLALKLCCHRHESVVCTDIAHIQYQESGAAESIIGCKLLTIPHREGKATPDALLKKLKSERAFGRHSTSPRVLSITQPTKEHNLLFHIDGSRFYNAAASLKVALSEIVNSIELDILSLGGTKNGLMGAEALLIFNSTLQEGSDHLQKQTLQLLSKTRFLSAQYIPFFKTGLWLNLAAKANLRAQEIASIIKTTPHLSLSHHVETNQIFFTVPSAWLPLIQEKIFCYLWDQEKNEVRFITSWNTSEQDVENVRCVLAEISLHSVY